MKLKGNRGLGVCLIAVAVGLALAIPANALGSNWKDKGVELKETRNMTLSGSWSFSGSVGGVSCSSVSSTFWFEPGFTGWIGEFSPSLSSCKGSGGLSGCTVSSLTVEHLPWDFEDVSTFIRVDGIAESVRLTAKFTGFFCPSSVVLSSTSIRRPIFTPDNTKEMHSFAISGELESSVGEAVKLGGEMKPVFASDSGTYGL
jgi:hypothetical protein